VLASSIFGHGETNIAMTVDPTNPNILYIGGTANGNYSGLIRVDATAVEDSHALVPTSNSKADGGASAYNSVGGVTEDNLTFGQAGYAGTSAGTDNFVQIAPYFNVTLDPDHPFLNNSTLLAYNTPHSPTPDWA
jgi:hypothetical protein